jgi:hypothetical protein
MTLALLYTNFSLTCDAEIWESSMLDYPRLSPAIDMARLLAPVRLELNPKYAPYRLVALVVFSSLTSP